MLGLKIHEHCGIIYYDPKAVKRAKKDRYWLMTGRVMQMARMAAGPLTKADDVKIAFKRLPSNEKHDALRLQRTYMRMLQQQDENSCRLIDRRHVETFNNFMTNPLVWSSVKRAGFGALPHHKKILSRRRETAHSYKNETISSVFGENDRLYLPLEQFDLAEGEEKKAEDQMIVLSRHPYDLLRMSQGRKWSSCMAWGELNSAFIGNDIKRGTMIAYVVDAPADHPEAVDWNISVPTTRCLFKPYTARKKDSVIYDRCHIYGDPNVSFKNAADKINREWFCRTGEVGRRYMLEIGLYSPGNEVISFKPSMKSENPIDLPEESLSEQFAGNLKYAGRCVTRKIMRFYNGY